MKKIKKEKKTNKTETKIGRIETDVNILKTDVSVLKKDVSILKIDVKEIKETMFTKKDNENFVEHLLAVMATKDDITEIHERLDILEERIPENFMGKMDEIMGEVQASRNERIRTSHRFLVTDDQVANHEKRIRVLEKTSR